MQIDQPTSSIKLPDELTNAIENGKNAVTLANLEVQRLRKLRGSEEVILAALENKKTEAQDALSALEAQVSTLKTQVSALEDKKRIADEAFSQTDKKLHQTKLDVADKTNTLNDIEAKVSKLEGKVPDLKAIIEKTNAEEQKLVDKVKSKRDKIEEFLKSL